LKVFQIKNENIKELSEIGGKKIDSNEKMVQSLIEHNLSIIFPSLEFLTTEYQIDNLRPDSIVFDNDRNSFVIIEYKNVKHKGVVDQGMSYYKLLQEKKENFVLLYHKIKGKVLDTDKDVNWDETRVIFISPEFTEHQKRASQSVNLPIELYEISKYENGIVLLNKIEDKKDLSSKSKLKSTSYIRLDEYSEDDYLEGKHDTQIPSEQTKKIYFKLKNLILDTFSDIEYKQKKKYAGFYSKKDGSAICTVEVKKNTLNLCYSVTKKDIITVNSFVKDLTGKGHWGIGNYMSEIKTEMDIEKSIPLIEKVHNFKVK
jgi:predicted transport protein